MTSDAKPTTTGRTERRRVAACAAWTAAIALSLCVAPARAEPSPGALPHPSRALQRANELFTSGDYYAASVALWRVLEDETKVGAADRQHAELLMGKALYELGYHAPSLSFFTRIVEQGPGHQAYEAALASLAKLSRVVPDDYGVVRLIGMYDPAAFERPALDAVRDELTFLGALHLYQTGDFEKAIEAFGRVRRSSPLFLDATFFRGVTYVRRYDAQRAVDAFKELLIIGRTRPPHYAAEDVARFEELATLQMARIFYSVGQYDLAHDYYGRISRRSPDYAAALLETAWAHIRRGQDSQSLAAVYALDAPFWKQSFTPEATMLAAAIFYDRCLYKTSLKTLGQFDASYGTLNDDLKQILGKYEDNNDLYDYLMGVAKSAGRSRTERVLAQTLRDGAVQQALRWVREIDDELERFRAAPKDWQASALGAEVLQDLTLHDALAKNTVGMLARSRLERTEWQLREHTRDAVKLKYEMYSTGALPESAAAATARSIGQPDERIDDAAPPESEPESESEPEPIPASEEDCAGFESLEDCKDFEDFLNSEGGSAPPFYPEPEPEPDPEHDALELRARAPIDPSAPVLDEEAWAFAPTDGGRGSAVFVIDGEHPVWRLNRGFGKSSHGDYRFQLQSTCPSTRQHIFAAAEDEVEASRPTADANARDDAERYDFMDDALVGELVRPDGGPLEGGTHYWTPPLFRVRADFLREILLSAVQLRAAERPRQAR